MNDSVNQFVTVLKGLPLSKKISMAFILVLVIAGFALMFFWANQEDYQTLFSNLSPEDGGAIVSKLKEKNVHYKVEANGTVIMVPAEKVYELRLALAGDGLPSGGNVGFEIFDHTDFRTPKFVQELNYRRALEGELARTINQFKEVKNSRVFLVLPKESLFIEERKPASASIQLDLRSALAPHKLEAVVRLVANAVEGLEPDQVTVVDTRGRVIFKGGRRGENASLLSDTQLDYERKVENEIRENVQTMLEGIVGEGKAIVRVTAEIDFNKITLNEEEYDPSAQVIRSMRNIEESSRTGEKRTDTSQGLLNRRAGVVPPSMGSQKTKNRKDVTTNYEINKVTRTIVKPAGTIKRLSVAAVIDGTYKVEKLKDGSIRKEYIPRSKEELIKFEEIVKRAMGYNEDREDQVSISSMPFSDSIPDYSVPENQHNGFDPLRLLRGLKKTIINVCLIVLVFFLIVRPLLRGLKNLKEETLSGGQEELPSITKSEHTQIPSPKGMVQKEKILAITQSSPEKAQQLIKGWISEQE